jgi:hypothetical protein
VPGVYYADLLSTPRRVKLDEDRSILDHPIQLLLSRIHTDPIGIHSRGSLFPPRLYQDVLSQRSSEDAGLVLYVFSEVGVGAVAGVLVDFLRVLVELQLGVCMMKGSRVRCEKRPFE